MAIAARSGTATITNVATAATGWTVTLPTYAADDFVVIGVASNVGSTAGTPTVTAGWSVFKLDESSGLKGVMLTKKMVGTEGTTITVTYSSASSGAAYAAAFTGVDTTTGIDAGPVGAVEPSASTVTPHAGAAITTVTANAVLVSLFTTDVAATWTMGDTEMADSTVGTISSALYYSAPVAVGTYTRTATASVASTRAVGVTVALRPATAVTTGRVQYMSRWR